jgi:hypothetical protein
MKLEQTLALLSFLMLWVVASCGPNSEKLSQSGQGLQRPSNGTQLRITSESIQGFWTSSCREDPKRPGVFVSESLKITELQVERTVLNSLDQNCFQRMYEQRFTGSYLFSSDGNYSERRFKMALKPLSPFSVSLFMRGKGLCSIQDWKLNESRETEKVQECGYEPVFSAKLSIFQNLNRMTLLVAQWNGAWVVQEFQK